MSARRVASGMSCWSSEYPSHFLVIISRWWGSPVNGRLTIGKTASARAGKAVFFHRFGDENSWAASTLLHSSPRRVGLEAWSRRTFPLSLKMLRCELRVPAARPRHPHHEQGRRLFRRGIRHPGRGVGFSAVCLHLHGADVNPQRCGTCPTLRASFSAGCGALLAWWDVRW